jgi:cytochrome c oxidase assembly factor CtaG
MADNSFAAHMIEHELLMLVAAPLVVAARPLPLMLWAWPSDTRHAMGHAVRRKAFRRTWALLTAPVAATAIQGAVLWVWHVPSLFQAALAHDLLHMLQHTCFFVAALLFWEAVFRRRAASDFVLVGCLFVTALTSGALGALMALSASPWYQAYAELGITPWGLTPLEDQQLAGLLMWIPGGAVHLVTALILISLVATGSRESDSVERRNDLYLGRVDLAHPPAHSNSNDAT